MEDDFKDKEISKSCPECKKMAFKGVVFEGSSFTQTIKCPYCKTQLFITIRKKTVVSVIKVGVLVLIIISLSAFQYIRNAPPMEAVGNNAPMFYTK